MSDQLLTLLLVDNDPIFRLGLATALNNFESIQVSDQANTSQEALEKLKNQSFSIILLEPELSPNSSQGWQLCYHIKQRYPQQKICLLSKTDNLIELLKAKERGIEGYCPKGFSIAQLVGILEQINQNLTYWQPLSLKPQANSKPIRRSWLSRVRQSGIEQINLNLSTINQQLNLSQVNLIDRLFLQGRKRELLTARWVVKQLLPVEVITLQEQILPENSLPSENSLIETLEEILPREEGLILLPSDSNSYRDIIFSRTLSKLQKDLENFTGFPLEIDILKSDKTQGLLLIVFHQMTQLFEQMRFAEISPDQLPNNLANLFDNLWEIASFTFLSKYTLIKNIYTIEEIQNLLEEDIDIIQEEILEKIPFLKDLFSHLLFETPLKIQGVDYRPESPESLEYAEKLLQNLLIQMANAVMVFVLNNFSDQETIKDNLYRKKLLSSREIAKFRNELSWQYRFDQYWETPKNIFESQYRIYFIGKKGLESTYFYCPRQNELENLQGVTRFVTIFLELRDAIAPRLRSVTGRLGEGLVYILTQVIGRAIGLIGRGILQGIGTTWQETRYGKNNSKQ